MNISKWLLNLAGWKITGAENAHKVPKKIFAVAPHTSNWDFPLGLLIRNAAQLETYYLGKKSLFKPPWGSIFRWLGGYPVDRSKHNHLVDTIVDIFNAHEKFAISIAPEGTRKKVKHFKTGFYYISKKGNIPIILTKFDAASKTVDFSAPFYPGIDEEKDLHYIESYFDGVQGINPEKSFYLNKTT